MGMLHCSILRPFYPDKAVVEAPLAQFVSVFLLAAHIKLDVINVSFMCAGAQFYGRGVVQVLTHVISHLLHCSIKAGIIVIIIIKVNKIIKEEANAHNYVLFSLMKVHQWSVSV